MEETSDTAENHSVIRSVWYIVVSYIILAGLWIVFSDQLLYIATQDPIALTHLQTYKGGAFILVSAALIGGLLYREIRKREHATAKIKLAEERYRSLFEFAPVMCLTTREVNGVAVLDSCNEAFLKTLGYAFDKVKGRPLTDFYTEASREGFLVNGGYALTQQGGIFDAERQLMGKDGRIIETLMRATLPQAVYVDITKRKHAERLLQNTNRRLKTLSACNQTLIRADDEGKLMGDICRNIVETGEYRMVRVALSGTDEAVLPVAQWGSEARDLDSTEQIWLDAEKELARIAMQDGKTCIIQDIQAQSTSDALKGEAERHGYASCIVLPLKKESGECFGALCIFADQIDTFSDEEVDLLTELAGDLAYGIQILRMQKEHFENEQRLQELGEFLPEGVCLLDSKYYPVLMNKRGREFLAAVAGDISGEVALTHLGHFAVEDALAASEKGQPVEIVAGEEPPRILEVNAQAIAGEVVDAGWIVTFREVTQAREIQEQVQQQERLAVIGQLAAGIAHDFNNMLTVIMGTAQILQMRGDLSGSLREDIDAIYVQGKRAAQLIRQVLDFSRQTIAERKPLSLVSMLKESVKLLQSTMPESIQIAFDLGAEADLVIEANPVQMQQIITNLAVNARDAMPDGGTLIFRLSRLHIGPGDEPPLPELREGDWVVWTATDTGSGMPSEVIARIFEPFFTTRRETGGTGLGLSQVYGIVKQYEGAIDVESAPGEGTTFTIYLPLLVNTETDDKVSIHKILRGQGDTILIVEDKPEVLKVARVMAEHLGYRVLTAANGQAALSVFRQHREKINLVLTDVVMPRMGGKELFEVLKEEAPELPVVFMSGYSTDLDGKFMLPEGMAGYLDKPLSMEQMSLVLKDAFNMVA